MRLTGLAVSPGIGIGKALLLTGGDRDLRFQVPAALVGRELDRLNEARTRAREQIQQIKRRVERNAGAEHAYLFDAQLLMLDDAMLIERAAAAIRDERLNAESALQHALGEISALFDQAEDPYLRERKGDVADVIGRLCMNLRQAGDATDPFKDVDGPLVLVADQISASAIAQLDWSRLAALATDEGSWTSHTAILARSIQVPAVAGLRRASAAIAPGALVAVDGWSGEVFVNPDATTHAALRRRQHRRRGLEPSLEQSRALTAVTADGVAVRLEANIESADDAAGAIAGGAAGIGLFRSEYLLAGGSPADVSEATQYAAYRRLIESAAPARVTIRTFDVGEGPPRLAAVVSGAGRAPLGRRGIRMSLAADDLFQTQLRSLLRAAAHGSLRIMFPFVSSVEELRAGRAAVDRAAAALRDRGEHAPAVPIGVMIEVPSAALTADLLARHADFFSIGTNDLIQYCLAIDRTDERVSSLYQPTHPAILRTLRLVVRAGRRAGIPVAVCGEMAADPTLLPLLIGLGVRELSMAPGALPAVKQVLRSLRLADTRVAARRALAEHTADDVRRMLDGTMAEHQPER